ncbi:ParA family protein [Sulfurimonas sp.]|uniref:ParA family protein n=1 Tax=Sulfurimonas sp. TaxID=2022749 RepID=UPI002B4793D1|nr:ParA family protein [Sulfurimonas sp.]
MNKLLEKLLNKLPFVIVFAHQKGGSGKSTICMNVSTELSKQFTTTFIDFDKLQQMTKYNNNREEPINSVVIKDERKLEQFLRNDKGLTVIDLGGYDSDLSRVVLLLADMIIIPMSDSDNDIDGFREFSHLIEKTFKIRTDSKAFILVNRVHHADKSTHRGLTKYVENTIFNVFDTVVRDNKLHTRLLSTGKNVVEKQFFSKPSKEIQSLVQEIIEKA